MTKTFCEKQNHQLFHSREKVEKENTYKLGWSRQVHYLMAINVNQSVATFQ